MTWQPNLSSEHCALAMNETDAILKIVKRRVTILVALSWGSGWPLSTAEDSLEGTAQKLTEGIRCIVSFSTPWVR